MEIGSQDVRSSYTGVASLPIDCDTMLKRLGVAPTTALAVFLVGSRLWGTGTEISSFYYLL